MKSFSVSEVIKKGWEVYKRNVWLLIAITLIVGIFDYVPSAIKDLRDQGKIEASIWLVALAIGFWLLSQLTELGSQAISLKLVDGKKAQVGDLFGQKNKLIQGILGSLIYAFVVIFGFILLVIPGIWLGTRLQFFRLLIVDRNLRATDALAESWKITKGHVWHLLGLFLVLIVMNILGALLMGIGLLVTAPITMLVMAIVYRKLN